MFRKKPDAIDHRARALQAEIAAVEATIKKLEKSPPGQAAPPVPRASPAAPRKTEPIFEPINQKRIHAVAEPARQTRERPLEPPRPGFRRFWDRIKKPFHAPSSENPRLVNYLAAGSIQGLRPLRYEKRVARNRFLLLVTILILVVVGGCYFFWRNR